MQSVSLEKSALFPLNTVLFPGSVLPLQIFEQRYLELIKDCMKNQHGFVVVLIAEGKEVGKTPEIHRIGTYAEIIDWKTLNNSLLGITIKGHHRVQIHDISVRNDGLVQGHTSNIETLTSDNTISDADTEHLTQTLKDLIKHPYAAERYPTMDCYSTSDICHRLSELLPVSNQARQALLETIDLKLQAEKLVSYIHKLEN